jgi:hypothetical protein
MKIRIALCAATVVLGFAAPDRLLAQAMPPPYPPEYPDVYPRVSAGLPPYEVIAIVSSAGFEPLSRPLRQGPVYVVRAADGAGRLMQVFVDARMGRVVRVAPAARRDAMSPYLSPPASIPGERMLPDGSGPNLGSRMASRPEGGGEVSRGERGPTPARAAPKPAAISPDAPAGPPPLPRPRPKMASAAADAAASSASAASNNLASAPVPSANAMSISSASAVVPALSASADPSLIEE